MVIKKATASERREYLKKQIERLGVWNINKTHVAKHFSVQRSVIYSDIEKVIHGIPATKLNEIKFEFDRAYRDSVAKLTVIIESPLTDVKDRISAIDSLNKIAKGYTDFMEAYGLKEKIAEKLEILDPASALIKKISDDNK